MPGTGRDLGGRLPTLEMTRIAMEVECFLLEDRRLLARESPSIMP